jgi:hypothetical protein
VLIGTLGADETLFAAEPHVLSACAVEAVSPRMILPETPLRSLDCSSSIRATAAYGEFEPASFVMRSTMPLPDLHVEIEDLVSGEARLPKSRINVKYVKAWYQSGSAWQGVRQDRGKRVLVPELLLNHDDLVRADRQQRTNYVRVGAPERFVGVERFSSLGDMMVLGAPEFSVRDRPFLHALALPAHFTKQVWLTFDLTQEVTPATYTGRVWMISDAARVRVSLPVSLTVLPIRLGEPDMEYALYYLGKIDPSDIGSISSEIKSRVQIRAELSDIRRHGVSNLTIYQDPSDIDSLEAALQERMRAGIDNRTIYYVGLNTGNYEATADVARRVAQFKRIRGRLAPKFGISRILVYGVDEAEPAAIYGQRNAWAQFKAAGASVFSASWRATSDEKYYAGRLSVLVLGSEPNPQVNEFFKKAGTRVFLYNQPQVGVEDPHIYRRNYGFRAWSAGFDGVMDFAYQRSMGFIWNDFDNLKYRDLAFAYPTADGVIDTIAWEGFREGIDDVRYVGALARLLTPGKVHDDEIIANIRVQALTLEPSELRRRIVDEVLRRCRELVGGPRKSGPCI